MSTRYLATAGQQTGSNRRSETTVNAYMVGVGQAEAFLRARGKGLVDASRADLEGFLGDLLTRRAPGTVATYYKALRILYGWLEEEEDEIPPTRWRT